jgi:hypothetical protein
MDEGTSRKLNAAYSTMTEDLSEIYRILHGLNNLKLAQSMRDELPREIRDMIYTYLLPSPTINIHDQSCLDRRSDSFNPTWNFVAKRPAFTFPVSKTYEVRLDRAKCMTWQMSLSTILGPRIYVETAQAWYERSKPIVALDCIDPFLKWNISGADFRPSDHIRSLDTGLCVGIFMERDAIVSQVKTEL